MSGDAGLLIDSDAFLVLAGSSLLGRTLELLGIEVANSFRLAPLPHMLAKSRSIKRHYSSDARHTASAACDTIAGIEERPTEEFEQSLLLVPDIGSGEAQLFALLAERPSYLLLSGDKRAMIAVATHPDLVDIRKRVAGRVICLEKILVTLVKSDGVATVGPAVRATAPNHKTLQVVFSDAHLENHAECIQALNSYIANLTRHVGPGFLKAL